jgi:hypothetical protein
MITRRLISQLRANGTIFESMEFLLQQSLADTSSRFCLRAVHLQFVEKKELEQV